jgi:hypothetical protein
MPKKSKQASNQKRNEEVLENSDYEQFLIKKISKCQRIVSELTDNPIWEEIKQDYENTAKGLDLSWAYEDVQSPRFKQMQASKMAVQTFMNLLPSYKHDLELAQKELEVFRSPEGNIKKDYDDEGVSKGQTTINTSQGNTYHS